MSEVVFTIIAASNREKKTGQFINNSVKTSRLNPPTKPGMREADARQKSGRVTDVSFLNRLRTICRTIAKAAGA
jgi:hypothetical protein